MSGKLWMGCIVDFRARDLHLLRWRLVSTFTRFFSAFLACITIWWLYHLKPPFAFADRRLVVFIYATFWFSVVTSAVHVFGRWLISTRTSEPQVGAPEAIPAFRKLSPAVFFLVALIAMGVTGMAMRVFFLSWPDEAWRLTGPSVTTMFISAAFLSFLAGFGCIGMFFLECVQSWIVATIFGIFLYWAPWVTVLCSGPWSAAAVIPASWISSLAVSTSHTGNTIFCAGRTVVFDAFKSCLYPLLACAGPLLLMFRDLRIILIAWVWIFVRWSLFAAVPELFRIDDPFGTFAGPRVFLELLPFVMCVVLLNFQSDDSIDSVTHSLAANVMAWLFEISPQRLAAGSLVCFFLFFFIFSGIAPEFLTSFFGIISDSPGPAAPSIDSRRHSDKKDHDLPVVIFDEIHSSWEPCLVGLGPDTTGVLAENSYHVMVRELCGRARVIVALPPVEGDHGTAHDPLQFRFGPSPWSSAGESSRGAEVLRSSDLTVVIERVRKGLGRGALTENPAKFDDGILDNSGIVLVLKCVTEAFEPREIEAVEKFVKFGGGLFLIGDHTNVFSMNDSINPIAEKFGVTFRRDVVCNPDGTWIFSTPSDMVAHPVTRGMAGFAWASGCSIGIRGDAEPLIVSPVFSFRDEWNPWNFHFFGDMKRTGATEFGSFVLAAVSRLGRGRVLAMGDSTCFNNYMMPTPGKYEFLSGALVWLSGISGTHSKFPRNRIVFLSGGTTPILDGPHTYYMGSRGADRFLFGLTRAGVSVVSLPGHGPAADLAGTRCLIAAEPSARLTAAWETAASGFVIAGGTLAVSAESSSGPAFRLLERCGWKGDMPGVGVTCSERVGRGRIVVFGTCGYFGNSGPFSQVASFLKMIVESP